MQIWKGGHGTKGKSSSVSLHCQKLEAHHPGVSTANTVEASSSHLHLVHLIQVTGHLWLLRLPFEIAFILPFRKKKKCVKNGVEGTKGREKLMEREYHIFSTNSFRVSRKSSPKVFVYFSFVCVLLLNLITLTSLPLPLRHYYISA